FDENVTLVLTNATGGAKLPGGTPISIATATLTIQDNDFLPGRLNFNVSSFTTNEDAPAALITVTRSGGSVGPVSAQFATVPGSAVPGIDYASTNGFLSWDDSDSIPKTFTVPLFRDGVVDGLKTVTLQLFDPRVSGTSNTNLLGLRATATLSIQDVDSYGA